jgi:hypothetical protein|tara:strand:+ start:34 stop:534 length:501 start_codon:yes stop_codon:yes gene_type:complete
MLGLGIGLSYQTKINLHLGDTYQGGLIFYLDGSGGGLIAAPSDQSNSAVWGCSSTPITGADGTDIGTGAQNTIDILAECTTADIAADLCRDLTIGAYSDWFLPSKDELTQMYNNLHQEGLGSFSSAIYWSSSEFSNTHAWRRDFNSGSQNKNSKGDGNDVRAIRSF